eukprot:NODE_1108_length_605_cov_119.163669_g1034_i0.p2 GENE.NODE_1108_length_605_cov_119.163669_g1034_i0~~NODE_1108_length_605_cov_119.163669_g1034_i0.p2  ORF type:complete len:136 (+),score=26.58 NODE_1108_length_605_cov_119.163669_g1034_i0:87-494(+)
MPTVSWPLSGLVAAMSKHKKLDQNRCFGCVFLGSGWCGSVASPRFTCIERIAILVAFFFFLGRGWCGSVVRPLFHFASNGLPVDAWALFVFWRGSSFGTVLHIALQCELCFGPMEFDSKCADSGNNFGWSFVLCT